MWPIFDNLLFIRQKRKKLGARDEIADFKNFFGFERVLILILISNSGRTVS